MWRSLVQYVEGKHDRAPELSESDLARAESQLASQLHMIKYTTVGTIEEESEEEESSGDEDGDTVVATQCFTPSEVAQAFSHFSYWATGRKRLICDLQGEYDEEANILRLSDPVIHYYSRHSAHKRNVHGRTDLGRKGISSFFATHDCTSLCNLVTRGFKASHHRKHNKEYEA